jgi:hypothetical protein
MSITLYPPVSSSGTDADAVHVNAASEISGVTEKGAPVGADFLLIEDSEAANAKKRLQITNLPAGGEINDLSASVTWANVPDANVTESSVTQHVGAINHDALLNFAVGEHFTQAAISITESQISDLTHFGGASNDLSDVNNDTPADKHVFVYDGVTDNRYENRLLVEADISDLGSYLTAETNDLSAAVTWANVPDANITESSVTQHTAAVVTTAAVTTAGALMDSEVDADIKTLALPANTTISAFGATVVDDADASAVRTTIGVDVAGTDNSTNVTLAGEDYLSLSTQEITALAINVDNLADGTDGELITWDASGVPATVAVGTATHVLTSNGVGAAPTFQAAAGGSGATPAVELLFEGTLSSATIDLNVATATCTWDDATEHADITHTDGDSLITIDNAGEYYFYFNLEVSNSALNNRVLWVPELRHRNSSDVEQFTYVMASSSYIRDDAATYNSGGSGGFFNLVVAAGDDVLITCRRTDTPGAGNCYLDNSLSYLRIVKKTYT